MSEARLRQAHEQLREEFIGYVEDLAIGSRTDGDLDQLIKLRHAIDALDHAIDKGWSQGPSPSVDTGG